MSYQYQAPAALPREIKSVVHHRVDGPQNRSGCLREEIISHLKRIRTPDHPVRSRSLHYYNSICKIWCVIDLRFVTDLPRPSSSTDLWRSQITHSRAWLAKKLHSNVKTCQIRSRPARCNVQNLTFRTEFCKRSIVAAFFFCLAPFRYFAYVRFKAGFSQDFRASLKSILFWGSHKVERISCWNLMD